MAIRLLDLLAVAALVFAPVHLSCSSSCNTIAHSAISVTVVDDKTGESLCDASVSASDGVHTAKFMELPGVDGGRGCAYTTFALGPGEYEVFISHEGYESEQLHDVEVHELDSACGGVEGAVRVARLQPPP